jgi:hypothetical protein
MRVLLASALLLIPLAACRPHGQPAKDPSPAATAANPPQAQATSSGPAYLDSGSPEGFVHHRDWSATAFVPEKKVQVGDYVLRDVYIGSTADFDRFEQQGHRGPAPFRLEFDRADGAKPVARSADLARKPALTIAASAYYVSELNDGENQHVFKFVGSDARLGRIRLQATARVPATTKFNPALQRAQPPSGATPPETLTGAFEANNAPQTFTADAIKNAALRR